LLITVTDLHTKLSQLSAAAIAIKNLISIPFVNKFARSMSKGIATKPSGIGSISDSSTDFSTPQDYRGAVIRSWPCAEHNNTTRLHTNLKSTRNIDMATLFAQTQG
jgi:hypothetical protein